MSSLIQIEQFTRLAGRQGCVCQKLCWSTSSDHGQQLWAVIPVCCHFLQASQLQCTCWEAQAPIEVL